MTVVSLSPLQSVGGPLSWKTILGKGVWIALLIGSAFRLFSPSLTAFGLDEGIASILTVQWVRDGQFPLVGVKTSLHFYNPPLLIDLLSPWFVVSSDPAIATLFAGILGIASVVAMGWVAGRLTGGNRNATAIAVLLAALSPFWIEHSRRLWGHAFVLPAATGALVFGVRWILDRKAWALSGVIAMIAAAQALHFSGSLLWIVFGGIWIATRTPSTEREEGSRNPGNGRCSRWRVFFQRRAPLRGWPILVGIAIAFLWYGPYFVHLTETEFQDVRIIAEGIRGGIEPTTASIGHPVKAMVFLMADGGHNDLMGTDPEVTPRLYQIARNSLRGASAILVIGSVVSGIGMSIRRKRRRGEGSTPCEPAVVWGLILAGVPLGVFWGLRVTFVPAYLLPAAPGIVLLLVVLCLRFLDRTNGNFAGGVRNEQGEGIWRSGIVGRGIVSLVSLTSVLSVLYWGSVWISLETASPGAPYCTTLRDQKAAVRWIAERAGTEPVLLTQGNRKPETGIDYSYTYLLWMETRDPKRFRRLEDWTQLFVVLDSRDNLNSEYAGNLNPGTVGQFGKLRVHEYRRPEETTTSLPEEPLPPLQGEMSPPSTP